MSFTKLKDNFKSFADLLFKELKEGESLTLHLGAEKTLFNRFSQSKLRQTTDVNQGDVQLSFNDGSKKVGHEINFTEDLELNIINGKKTLQFAREELAFLPNDPYLVPVAMGGESCKESLGNLLDGEQSFKELLTPLATSDSVGIYTSGKQLDCLADSKGTYHSFETDSFYVDYSLFSPTQKAVKDSFGMKKWDSSFFEKRIKQKQRELELMGKTEKVLAPGAYRVYLSPRATNDLVSMLGWYGLSYADFKQGQSCLADLEDNKKSFSEKFSLTEDFSLGLTPQYNSLGEVSSETTPLIDKGQLSSFLISSRSSKEYSVDSNFADEGESPRSLSMNSGELKEEDILKELGTGIYISDVWYLNWSDVAGARVTGMTRYACFWVEDGKMVGPIKHMRFDESLYNCLGDSLIAVTKEQEIIPSTDSYGSRSFGGSRFPGIICDNFHFTL